MSNNRVGRVAQQLHHAAALSDAQTSDGQLLAAFIAQRDEAAFAALVRRYGPMVLGVCRRVLRNTSDADDAFQAAFLVLVRRAAEVRSRASLGNWLYGVAYRTALHARTANARRRRIESQVRPLDQHASPEDAAMHSELRNLLDQELDALPAKYRELIVLCDLLGTTKREAAQQLRCPEGTVSSRLARGRELLRKRLARHGKALSLAALAALLEQNKAPAAAPLIDTTVKTAVLVAAGNVAAAGALTPNAAVLMEGVLKSMLFTKLKTVVGVILLIALFGATMTLIACRSLAGTEGALPIPPSPMSEKRGDAPAQETASTPRYVMYPVTTELQRQLVPAQTNLFVMMDTTEALKGNSVSLKDLHLDDLRKDLLKRKKDDTCVHFTLFFKREEGKDEEQTLLRYAVIGFTHEMGFSKVSAYGVHPNSEITWEELVDPLTSKKARQPKGNEMAKGDDFVKVYAVGTELSRFLTSDADCVIRIAPSLNKEKGTIPENIRKATAKYIIELRLAHKKRASFLVQHVDLPEDQKEKLLDGLLQLAKELGFESSEVTFR